MDDPTTKMIMTRNGLIYYQTWYRTKGDDETIVKVEKTSNLVRCGECSRATETRVILRSLDTIAERSIYICETCLSAMRL